MKNILYLVAVFSVMVLLAACNKTKKFSKRLSGETWQVTGLTVDGVSQDELPVLVFDDCDIYDETCKGEWENPEGAHAEFIWQIREKGEVIEFSNQSTLEGGHVHGTGANEHVMEETILQCQEFSGVYAIKEHKKKSMRFESTATLGFPGHQVIMVLERK